jgi:excisionase family DNA binding protein
MPKSQKWLSLAQAAEVAGVTVHTVRRLIERGALTAHNLAVAPRKNYRIDPDVLHILQASPVVTIVDNRYRRERDALRVIHNPLFKRSKPAHIVAAVAETTIGQPPAAPPSDRGTSASLLTENDAGKLAGVSRKTIRKLIDQGQLRACNYGTVQRKLYRIHPDDLRNVQVREGPVYTERRQRRPHQMALNEKGNVWPPPNWKPLPAKREPGRGTRQA